MAGFKTHVTFSSAIGVGYAVVGSACGFDLSTSLVAGGLCGVAGMLPDVDSDSGVPRRESLGFAAAIVPMLLMDRFKQFDLSHDQMVLIAATLYFGIRFTLADLIGRWSVHRGMWHSIPAILIFMGLAFLMAGPSDADVFIRYFKAAAVGIGSFSHLLLDEIYSVDTTGVVPRFKKSFGSAIKFWGKDSMANFSTYGKLAVVVVAILMEPAIIDRLELRNPEFAAKVRSAKEGLSHLPSSPIALSGDATGSAAPSSRTEPTLQASVGQERLPSPTPRLANSQLPNSVPPAGGGNAFMPSQRAPSNYQSNQPTYGRENPYQAPASNNSFQPNRTGPPPIQRQPIQQSYQRRPYQ